MLKCSKCGTTDATLYTKAHKDYDCLCDACYDKLIFKEKN